MSEIDSPNNSSPMTDFRFAWIRIIADAWSDPEVFQRLLAETPDRLRQRFQQYGAIIPEDMDIKIVAPGPDDHWESTTRTWITSRAKVELPLPPKPKDESQIGVALATYEWVGKNYPFSCCC